MLIEVTLVDGARPIFLRGLSVHGINRNIENTATLVATPSGTFSVLERPEIVSELLYHMRPGEISRVKK